jgi:hypothetical protein
MVAQLISRHGPDFVLFFFHFFTDVFNVFFLVQAETPPAAQQNTFSESLKKARRRPQAPLFSVWIVAKKN